MDAMPAGMWETALCRGQPVRTHSNDYMAWTDVNGGRLPRSTAVLWGPTDLIPPFTSFFYILWPFLKWREADLLGRSRVCWS